MVVYTIDILIAVGDTQMFITNMILRNTEANIDIIFNMILFCIACVNLLIMDN